MFLVNLTILIRVCIITLNTTSTATSIWIIILCLLQFWYRKCKIRISRGLAVTGKAIVATIVFYWICGFSWQRIIQFPLSLLLLCQFLTCDFNFSGLTLLITSPRFTSYFFIICISLQRNLILRCFSFSCFYKCPQIFCFFFSCHFPTNFRLLRYLARWSYLLSKFLFMNL